VAVHEDGHERPFMITAMHNDYSKGNRAPLMPCWCHSNRKKVERDGRRHRLHLIARLKSTSEIYQIEIQLCQSRWKRASIDSGEIWRANMEAFRESVLTARASVVDFNLQVQEAINCAVRRDASNRRVGANWRKASIPDLIYGLPSNSGKVSCDG